MLLIWQDTAKANFIVCVETGLWNKIKSAAEISAGLLTVSEINDLHRQDTEKNDQTWKEFEKDFKCYLTS